METHETETRKASDAEAQRQEGLLSMEMSAFISKQRLSKILERASEGSPDYWYGVVEPHAGSLMAMLFMRKDKADHLAKGIGGRVVIVAARILEDEDGEEIEPEN